MIWSRPRSTTILVSRSDELAAPFCAALEARGIHIVDIPSSHPSDPPSWGACDNAIRDLESYHGIFFSNRITVDYFLSRVHTVHPGMIRILLSRHLFAVGDKTEDSLHDAGLFSVIVPRSSSIGDLELMLNRAGTWQKKYLFPRKAGSQETFPDHIRRLGSVVDEIDVVADVFPPPQILNPLRTLLTKGEVDAAAFFDPSRINNAVEVIGRAALARTKIAVFGPATAQAAREVGLTPRIIARSSTAEAFAEEVLLGIAQHA